MTEKGLDLNDNGTLKYSDLFEDKSADFFTKGGVGGEHSRYTKIGEPVNGYQPMEFYDE